MEQLPIQPTSEYVSQETPIDIPPKTKKKSNKWLIIVLVLLFLSAAGVAGYFAYQNNQLKKEVIQTGPTPSLTYFNPEISPRPSPTNGVSPIPSQTLSVSVQPKSTTNTFRNENFGYEISYPKTWQNKENVSSPCPDTAEVVGTGSVVDLSKGGFSETSKDFIRPRLQIEAMPGYQDGSIENYVKSPSGCFIYKNKNMKNITDGFINTNSGQQIYVTTATLDNDPSYGGSIFYGCGYITVNQILYILTWHDSQGQENPLLKEVFATIKFFTPGRNLCR